MTRNEFGPVKHRVNSGHVITAPHFGRANGPSSLTCSCGEVVAADSCDALCTRWRDHRAARGLGTPSISDVIRYEGRET